MKGGFGSPEYAKEELRAEMTSVTVNGMLRLPHDPDSHASYVGAWIKTLEDNPNELRYAARGRRQNVGLHPCSLTVTRSARPKESPAKRAFPHRFPGNKANPPGSLSSSRNRSRFRP